MLAGLQCGWKATPAEGLQPALVRAPRRAPVPAGGAQSDAIPQAVVGAGVRSAALESWRRSWRLLAVVGVILALLAGCSFDPDTAKRKYLENGNKYFARGKYREASIMYRSALKKDRRYGEAYYRLGLAEIRRQQIPSAVAALRRAVELQPDNEDAKVELANIYLISYTVSPSKKEEIRGEIQRLTYLILKSNPGSFHAFRIQGQLALFDRDYKTSLAHFEAAEKIKPGDPDVTLGSCQALNALNQFERCEQIAWGLIQRQPKFEPVYDLLYRYYLDRNRIDDASRVLEEKLSNNFNKAGNILALARHYWVYGKPELTAKTFERVFAARHLYPNGRRMAAEFYWRSGDPQTALGHLRAGIRENQGPERQACERRMVEVLADQGNLEEARRMLASLLKANPKDPDLAALRASLAISSGAARELAAEVRELETIVRKSPRNPALRYQLGRLLWDLGQTEQAKPHLMEAARLGESYAGPRMALAQIFLNERDAASALKYSEEAIRLAPMEPRAHWLHAEALFAAGRTAQALEQLRAAVARFADRQEAWLRLGNGALRAKDFTTAELAFRGCAEKFHSAACLAGQAEVLTAQRQAARGIRLLEEQIQQRPSDRELKLALADLYAAQGRHSQALSLYQGLVASDQGSLGLRLRLGKTMLEAGNPNGALAEIQAALGLDPNSPNGLHLLTVALTALGRKAEALAACEKLLKLQPNDPIVLNNAAYLLAETGGDLERALTYAQRAARMAPASLEFSDTLGWVYLKKRLPANSAEVYSQLIQQQPNNPTFRYRHALALYLKGDTERAASEARAALQQNPPPDQAREIRELLAKAR